MSYRIEVRFNLNGEYDSTEIYYMYIKNTIKEDDVIDVLINEVREELNKDFEGDENWEDGKYDWTIDNFEKQ